MRSTRLLSIVGVLMVIAGSAILLQSQAIAQDAQPTAVPEPFEGFGAPLEGEPPYLSEIYQKWAASPHADTEAEAFVHWNAEGGVPQNCARCHSTPGFIDFVGGDGSEPLVVDAPAPLNTVLTCDGCHNGAAMSLASVTFPSGVTITEIDSSAQCMQCHQGRASTEQVNAAIDRAGATGDPDTISADLSFVNIHYYAAAATLFGGEARGGYQFEGKFYQPRNLHAPGINTCADCHDVHSTEVKVELCADCHDDVETVEDLPFIRMNGSLADYDGDEDNFEGIAEEIEGLQEMLWEAITSYASEVSGTPIGYNEHAHPYFFADPNDDGEIDEEEAIGDNRYNAFTPTLLKAAYNYQVSLKDPGAYAHNPKYIIELLYDSIEALNAGISDPVDLEFATRDDIGHFQVTAEAFRHWDAEGEVPASCSRCHSAGGLPFFIEHGVTIKSEPSQSLECSTCHDWNNDFDLFAVDEVTFPSGAVVSFGEGDENNLCMTCHQGRESTVSVNNAITRAGVGADEVATSLTFRNVHYFAAGATLFGTEAKGAYEFAEKEYNGRFWHVEEAQVCSDCHEAHTGIIQVNTCEDCHEDVEFPEDARLIRQEAEDVEPVDYDGDGDVEEPIADEIASFQNALYAAMQSYSAETAESTILYSPVAYPYFFNDTNGNSTLDEEEANNDNRFVNWTPNLLGAAYNYQFSNKDPGAFAHNADYILQVLYDSIEALGGADAVAELTRPPVIPPGEAEAAD